MEAANTTIHIESLDEGFIVEHDGKRKALKDNVEVFDFVIKHLKEIMKPIHSINTKDMYVKLEVDFNLPKSIS